MATAYTRSSLGSFTISSTGQTALTDRSGVNSDSSDYVTLYASIRFTKSGTATLQCSAVTFGSVRVDSEVAKSSVAFNTNTGWPQTYDAYGHNSVSTSLVDIVSLSVSAGQTYNFYFDIYSGSATLLPYINFTESGSDYWTKDDIYIGRLTEDYSRTIQSAEDHKLYCFEFSLSQSGGYVELTGGTADSLAWVTEDNSLYVFDRTTGYIDETYSTDSRGYNRYTYYPGGSSIQLNTAGTMYLWVRLHNDYSGSISFKIYPPGSSGSPWGVDQLKSATQVTVTGVSWSIPSSYTKTKMLEYIGLTFASAGTYQFKAEGSEPLYGYLASSLDIDDDEGKPLPSVLLASNEGNSGFTFSYDFVASQISSGQTYYLMLRTPSGSSNVSSFTLSVTPTSATFVYDKQTSENDPVVVIGKRELTYSLAQTSDAYHGIYFQARFDRTGSAVVKVTSTSPPDTIVYVTTGDYGYNRGTGAPYTSSEQEAGGASQQAFSVDNGDLFYIWIRGVPPNATGSIVVEITLDVLEWTYTVYPSMTDVSGVTVSPYRTISEKTGARFQVSFRQSGKVSIQPDAGSNVILYITKYDSQSATGHWGFSSEDGVPYKNSSYEKATGALEFNDYEVLSGINDKYWIWISPGNTTGSRSLRITFTPASAKWKNVTKDSIIEPSSTATIQFTSTESEMYHCAIEFSEAGEARFYSDTSMSLGLSAWLTSGDSGIDEDNGVPNSSALAYDNDGGAFTITYTVASGTTYYLWWRAPSKTDSGEIIIYVKPPDSSPPPTPTDIGFWIGVKSDSGMVWRKVTLYIGNASREWVKSEPYIGIDDNNPHWIDEY